MSLTQISTAGVKDDAVTAAKIPANAVGSSELADDAVDTAAIADNAVTGAKINDANVTTSKIADQAVTLDKLPHGTSSNDGKFLRANNGADPTFESLPASGVTVSNNVNNRVITGDGTNLNAESALTFDGTTLDLPNVNQYITGGGHNVFQVDATRTYLYGGTNGVQFRTADNSAEIASIDNSGNLKVKDADIIIGTTGHGINFDTAGSGSDQLLDDYEEGTFSLTVASGGFSSVSGTGTYTKIGRVVNFQGDFTLNGSGNSDVLKLDGLPFAANSWVACSGYTQNYGNEGSQQASFAVRGNTNDISVVEYGNEMAGNGFSSGYLNVAGCYQT